MKFFIKFFAYTHVISVFAYAKEKTEHYWLDRLEQKTTISAKSPFEDFDKVNQDLEKNLQNYLKNVLEKKTELLTKIQDSHEIEITVEQLPPYVIKTLSFTLNNKSIFENLSYYPLSLESQNIPLFNGPLPTGSHIIKLSLDMFDTPKDDLEQNKKIFERIEGETKFSVSSKDKKKLITITLDIKNKKYGIKESVF